MSNYESRAKMAQAYYEEGLRRVSNTPEPEGQKFSNGSRVLIANDLGSMMSNFSGKGKTATVEYVYCHAYGGDDNKSYCLNIDGIGSSAWYLEHQLTAI